VSSLVEGVINTFTFVEDVIIASTLMEGVVNTWSLVGGCD